MKPGFSLGNCLVISSHLIGKITKVQGFQGGGSDSKESTCNAGDLGVIPGLGRSPGGGHGYPLQYSCLENPQGQRSLVGTVHTVAKSWTGLKRLSLSIFSRPGIWNHTCDHQFPLPSMPCCPDFLRCICDTSLLAGKYNFLGGNIIYLV